jgi:hypothetical protein
MLTWAPLLSSGWNIWSIFVKDADARVLIFYMTTITK